MRETIKAGTVLIKEGMLLPETLVFESEPYLPGWRSVTGLDGYPLGAAERRIHRRIDADHGGFDRRFQEGGKGGCGRRGPRRGHGRDVLRLKCLGKIHVG